MTPRQYRKSHPGVIPEEYVILCTKWIIVITISSYCAGVIIGAAIVIL